MQELQTGLSWVRLDNISSGTLHNFLYQENIDLDGKTICSLKTMAREGLGLGSRPLRKQNVCYGCLALCQLASQLKDWRRAFLATSRLRLP